MVGYTSIKTADAEIEGGNGSVARDPGVILTEHMYDRAFSRQSGLPEPVH
jgi:hypothetical protein